MKIPNKLILFCEEYQIKIIPKKEMLKLDKEKKDTQGMITLNSTNKEKIIYIVESDKEEMEDIFWHEIGHYFAYITETKDNEPFAQNFSHLIRGVLKQL